MATLVLGTLLGGTALAVTSGSEKGSDEYGEMGASPVPVVAGVSGPTSFRVSTFNILGDDHTGPGGTKKGYAVGETRMKWTSQLIKSRNVDVVGLQEFQQPQFDVPRRRPRSTTRSRATSRPSASCATRSPGARTPGGW